MSNRTLFEERILEAGFSEEQLQKINVIADSVCRNCRDSDPGCYCTYDSPLENND